ncbi:CPBP family intramembrane metalloprotease [Adhaeribacter arboris]|uniref:CPBP family intramembrane metalloprotease n=1 Tax=Adhaeribacter arboris TaxID=2072846 RepID=A0A2T2YMY8_9BACT|nr:type II CAAX endopeptidase family protein [Adhaeribacter arboris]PSR56849.1 CPBP family intramembrane metalloprotease [Adhaeribacter arboris]
MEYELRSTWKKTFEFNWKFGLFLILIVCVPRFILVLNANVSGNYGVIGLVMLLSALAPFIFLTKSGRLKIGITKPQKYSWLVIAFIAGLVFSFLLYFLGESLFCNTVENWYAYIGKSYNIPSNMPSSDKAILFTIVALTGMTFSPIGEELFFRGIVHSSFAESIGDKNASVVDSAAFAVVHISHFGLVYLHQQWKFLWVPALLWVISMFLVSVLFFACRRNSGSILGAILCHAAFNLGMIYCIFYLL